MRATTVQINYVHQKPRANLLCFNFLLLYHFFSVDPLFLSPAVGVKVPRHIQRCMFLFYPSGRIFKGSVDMLRYTVNNIDLNEW